MCKTFKRLRYSAGDYMKYLELEIYNDFVCVGAECPFTCCAGWGILIDSPAYEYYEKVGGDFGARLSSSIYKENGMYRFALTERARCAFLNDQNLCDIYTNLGEDHLCYTCRTYPRYSFLAGDILFSGVSVSCPEVARFFLNHKEPLQIDFKEDCSPVPNEALIDWNSFNYAIRAFTTAVEIGQERTLSICSRLSLLTVFIRQFQDYIDLNKNPSELFDLFLDHTRMADLLPQTGKRDVSQNCKVIFVSTLLGYFRRLERFELFLPELSELVYYFDKENSLMKGERLDAAYALLENGSRIWMEQLLVYTLYRYFMRGFEDKAYYDKFMIGLILIFELSIYTVVLHYVRWEKLPQIDEVILIVAHTSRIVEHEDNLRNMALKYFDDKGITKPDFLLDLFGDSANGSEIELTDK